MREHENEPIRFVRVITTLFGAKQPMEREGDMVDGQDNTKQILATDDIMMPTAKPAPCTSQKFTKSINDTVVNR